MSEAEPRATDTPDTALGAISDEALLARFVNTKNAPPSSKLLGFQLTALSQNEKWVEALFVASPTLANPMGQVQGGYLTAMLDEVMSVAGLVASGMACVMPTLEMKTSFLRPAAADGGTIRGIGRILRWGKTIAFTEGDLFDPQGRLIAKASGTALPTPFVRFKR
jgi:uncharacterized protein (TIGR00369 family)